MTAKPIVTGIDGSEDALWAAAWAAREAELRHESLVIVSVLPPLPWLTPSGFAPALTAAAREGTERALATAVERAKEQATALTVTAELLSGRPGPVLAERAAGALMLVVSSSGADGFAAVIPGSVSRYATAHAPCPVVVVCGESTAVHGEIVVGVSDPDLPDAAAALRFAFTEAALRRARLVAVHAWYWSVPGSPAGPSPATRRRGTSSDRRAGRVPGLLPWPGGQPGCRVRPPRPGACRGLRAGRSGRAGAP